MHRRRTESSISSARLLLSVAAALLLAVVRPAEAQPETSILLTSHFDVARQAPIASVVYQHPFAEKVFVNGFVEAWWNTDIGFPEEKVTVFSKNWVSYSVTPRLSTSLEVEFLYNRPGVAIKFPQEITFQEEKVYVIPKIGLSYRVK